MNSDCWVGMRRTLHPSADCPPQLQWRTQSTSEVISEHLGLMLVLLAAHEPMLQQFGAQGWRRISPRRELAGHEVLPEQDVSTGPAAFPVWIVHPGDLPVHIPAIVDPRLALECVHPVLVMMQEGCRPRHHP